MQNTDDHHHIRVHWHCHDATVTLVGLSTFIDCALHALQSNVCSVLLTEPDMEHMLWLLLQTKSMDAHIRFQLYMPQTNPRRIA